MANKRRWIITLLAVSAACPLLTGCVTALPWLATKDTVPIGPVAHVATTWENEVLISADPVNKGRPTPCLSGRMYLLGKDIKNGVKANGAVAVQLFVELPSDGPMPRLKLIEQWNIDGETIHRLGKKDLMWGYTLFLPWTTYDPRINKVQLSVCYTPEGGAPIYARSRLRLRHQRRRFTMTKNAQSPRQNNRQAPSGGQNVLPQPRQMPPQLGGQNPNPSGRRVITRSNQTPIR